MFDLGATILKITDGSSIIDRGMENLLLVKTKERSFSKKLLVIEHLSKAVLYPPGETPT